MYHRFNNLNFAACSSITKASASHYSFFTKLSSPPSLSSFLPACRKAKTCPSTSAPAPAPAGRPMFSTSRNILLSTSGPIPSARIIMGDDVSVEDADTPFVISVVGPDRIGIAKDISKIISDFRMNINDSRATRLAGDFAMICTAGFCPQKINDKVHDDAVEALSEKLAQKLGQDFNIVIRSNLDPIPNAANSLWLLHSVGIDSPGILDIITSMLERYNVSAVDINAGTGPAPLSGELYFEFDATVEVSEDSVEDIHDALRALDHEYALETTFVPKPC